MPSPLPSSHKPEMKSIFRNYFENAEHFVGIGNYTDEGFAEMRKAVPLALRVFKEALTVPGLKIVFGTDPVAGAHGRNYQELVYRIEKGGQDRAPWVGSPSSRRVGGSTRTRAAPAELRGRGRRDEQLRTMRK